MGKTNELTTKEPIDLKHFIEELKKATGRLK